MENYRRAPVDGRLGNWLREMRQKKGWSMAHVVRHTQACTTQHLSMVELGQRRPSLKLVTQLCEAYGVSPSAFEGLEEFSGALSEADHDRYTLIRIICLLDETQRLKVHRVLAPMLEAIIDRRSRALQRFLTTEETR